MVCIKEGNSVVDLCLQGCTVMVCIKEGDGVVDLCLQGCTLYSDGVHQGRQRLC
jgi:hypothetical protein